MITRIFIFIRIKNSAFTVNSSKSNINGFILSWHIESRDLVRNYWFTQTCGARFFPSDVVRLWPKYFKDNQRVNVSLTKKLKQMTQVKDEGFIRWYETTTGDKLWKQL